MLTYSIAVALLAIATIAFLELGSPPPVVRLPAAASPPIRLIHTHGSRSVDTARRDPVLPVVTTPAIDAGAVDPLADREAIYDAWRYENNAEWLEMDSAIRSCARIRFVNSFGKSMEEVIDECLDYYESEIDDE